MKTRKPPSRKGGRRLRDLLPGPRGVVILSVILYAALFAGLSVYKHEIYSSSRFDLGNMDQAVWNSSEGRILEATDEQGELTSRLKNHADFLLLAFVPFYWIAPSPYWLLIFQAAVVGLGALPLFWLARRFLKKQGVGSGEWGVGKNDTTPYSPLPTHRSKATEWSAALIAVAYLFNPGLQSANLFDFHAQMMAGTFLLFAFHYLLEKRLLPFVVSGALAALTKEGIVLIVAMMGLYALFVLRRPRWGAPVFLAGAGYFLLVMLVAIPAFNAGDPSRLVEGRYEAFGGSIGGLIRTGLTDPLFTISFLLSGDKPLYLASLLGATGFLGLLAPPLLAIPLPELAINLLSSRPQMVSINYHYSAAVIPFVYLAAAAGIRNLVWGLGRLPFRWPSGAVLRKLPLVLAAGVLLLGVQLDYETGPLPLFRSEANGPSVVETPSGEHLRALDEAVALIPDGARVSATNALGAHLAHRRYLYIFPTVKDAEYVIVDEMKPAYQTEVSPVLNLESVQRLEENPGYRKVFDRDGVLVFERTAETGTSG